MPLVSISPNPRAPFPILPGGRPEGGGDLICMPGWHRYAPMPPRAHHYGCGRANRGEGDAVEGGDGLHGGEEVVVRRGFLEGEGATRVLEGEQVRRASA